MCKTNGTSYNCTKLFSFIERSLLNLSYIKVPGSCIHYSKTRLNLTGNVGPSFHLSCDILAKLNVNWQGLQFIFKKIFYSKQILWNLKLHSKTHPIKSTTPFKASYISKTQHCMLKFVSPLFADNIQPISMYKNITILNTVFIYHIMRLHLLPYYKYWYWESN